MQLHWIDWIVIGSYVAFAVTVGIILSRRASKNVDEFFLSGRSLPWWVAGTSMVATTFAADTPLVVSGWVRDHGIWKNWLWWCFAISGMLGVFLFSRWWRRGEVMTKAEIAELRYGGADASLLRGFVGIIHASVTNTIVLCWVLLAAGKIVGVLLGVDKGWGVAAGCAIALSYSLLAGFWGVVLTDLVQFVMAVAGAVILAVAAWGAIGGTEGLQAAAAAGGAFGPDTLRMLPRAGEGSIFESSFWSINIAAFAVYLGVLWWASEGVDGSGTSVQRIAASRNDRDGMLAVLWYNIAHYAIRPWPWIVVGLASLIILPPVTIESPVEGLVTSIEANQITVQASEISTEVSLLAEGTAPDWLPEPRVEEGQSVERGDVLARTDSERAYVVMMTRYLGIGLLGLVAASLLAAFMSTIDTHINLASSFFVNDVYRRFVADRASDTHYVLVARLASVAVLVMGGFLAYSADHIGNLFQFFLAFLGGVGPVYVLRWLWWRIRASTEITAMLASVITTITVTTLDITWSLGPLSPDGVLSPEGRQIIVVGVSSALALASLFVTRTPDPRNLVAFYEKVRPLGWWGPVRALTDARPDGSWARALLGAASALALVYGILFGTGAWLLGESQHLLVAGTVAVVGGAGTILALRGEKKWS